ncbi:hypothetical protein GCM10022248_73930 [Nonomuraea soli]
MHRGGCHAALAALDELVVVPHDAGEDADVLAGQGVGRVSGVFQRVPAGLEEQPFLGVHALGVATGDPEEGGVEAVDAVDEAAPLAVGLARAALLGVEEGLVVPPVGRDLGDAVASFGQVAPEGVEVGGLRIPSGEPDDRDPVLLVVGGRRLLPHVCGLPYVLCLPHDLCLPYGTRQQLGDPVALAVQHDEPAFGPRQSAIEHLQRVAGGQRRQPGRLPRTLQRLGPDLHASVGPVRPADGQRPARPFAPERELLQVGVGEAVPCLAGVGQRGRQRGEDHEEVQVVSLGGVVEVLHAERLGRHDGLDVGGLLPEVGAVAVDARAVDDAVDPPVSCPDGVEGPLDLVPVGEVGPHLGAPADRHGPGVVASFQVFGDVPPDPAGAAGDHVDAVPLDGDLAGLGLVREPPSHHAPVTGVADLGLVRGVAQGLAQQARVVQRDAPASDDGRLR